MNIEQKAKAYDKALDDIRAIYPNLKGDAKLAVEHAFPELAESEDERIRKNILTKMRACQKQSNFFSNDEIAWLEKQKEQKPAEWSEEDNNALDYLHELISFGYTENFFDAQTAADMRTWLNSHISAWRGVKSILQEKDFRGDEWRLAYNAFMFGFSKGLNTQSKKK